MKLYHFTLRDNVVDIIMAKKLKADICNHTYVTPTMEDATKFAYVYSKIDKRSLDDYVVFELSELDIDKAKLNESYDHNSTFFGGAKALVYEGDIPFNEFEIYDISINE